MTARTVYRRFEELIGFLGVVCLVALQILMHWPWYVAPMLILSQGLFAWSAELRAIRKDAEKRGEL